MYVARFTQTPENDVERGWSGYFAPFMTDLHEALDFFGFLPEDEDADLEEIADKMSLVQDPHTGAWRPFHHSGLSCWELSAETESEALQEAATANIEWAGFGQRTIGTIRLVGKVEGVTDLYVFECEDIADEC